MARRRRRRSAGYQNIMNALEEMAGSITPAPQGYVGNHQPGRNHPMQVQVVPHSPPSPHAGRRSIEDMFGIGGAPAGGMSAPDPRHNMYVPGHAPNHAPAPGPQQRHYQDPVMIDPRQGWPPPQQQFQQRFEAAPQPHYAPAPPPMYQAQPPYQQVQHARQPYHVPPQQQPQYAPQYPPQMPQALPPRRDPRSRAGALSEAQMMGLMERDGVSFKASGSLPMHRRICSERHLNHHDQGVIEARYHIHSMQEVMGESAATLVKSVRPGDLDTRGGNLNVVQAFQQGKRQATAADESRLPETKYMGMRHRYSR